MVIAGEDKTKVEQISHEDIEDAVMSALPTLDTSQLEGLYELIGLDLVADNKGKKRVYQFQAFRQDDRAKMMHLKDHKRHKMVKCLVKYFSKATAKSVQHLD